MEKDITEYVNVTIPITTSMVARWFKELFDGAEDIKAIVNEEEKDNAVLSLNQEENVQYMTIWEKYAIYFFHSRKISVEVLEDYGSWAKGVLRFHTVINKLFELANKNLPLFAEIIGDKSFNCFDRAMFLISCVEKSC